MERLLQNEIFKTTMEIYDRGTGKERKTHRDSG
jgi:hypothetical protein